MFLNVVLPGDLFDIYPYYAVELYILIEVV